ncbi:maleylpyruvate isomerase family mycothiol-dependent enzyme [Mycolicibacterium komossense]|uniref:Maleylpyruvate isomerase family mycothiol-dependent enzyme n=1 Tax=Mycolicibacterium komossense TaxID=1779 RepID=A0ABT3CI12_9MYCO|nr:maleylpyruvate isomerase family mycothiol-dependent enzyme [Mycolicibacterium komossense]MCV7229100.1 maleylpyruvate isomerase family mycothiol-dependent enzyme [Mycolicibacterium komossense]
MTCPSRPVAVLDKFDVLSGLFESWAAIDRLVAGLSEPRWQAPTSLPGWCVYDVVAHIIGTESMLGGAPTPGSDVDVATLGHVRNGVAEMNECWVRHLRGGTGADLLTRFRAVTGERRSMLEAMSEADWNAPAMTPAGQATYGRFMRIRVFDCWMHEQDIREAILRPSSDEELSGPEPRLVLDEMAATMGFVVGKLGKAPAGSRVAIELTGPMARTICIAVDGRAAVVDDFGAAQPTVTIRTDGLQFTRICGGRPLTAARSSAIDIEGDTEVGDRIVEHLNYVM